MNHCEKFSITLIMLTWRIWWAHNNASKWQMGFNSAFEGLNRLDYWFLTRTVPVSPK